MFQTVQTVAAMVVVASVVVAAVVMQVTVVVVTEYNKTGYIDIIKASSLFQRESSCFFDYRLFLGLLSYIIYVQL